jgi:predicted Kef-type K+ transport protein
VAVPIAVGWLVVEDLFTVVFTGEGEAALALTEAILHRLGATPEQIDHERERAHTELFGETPTTGTAIA